MVYTVIIITEAWEFAIDIKAFSQADFITFSGNFSIFDSRK